jgi:hypothetical protein
MHYLELPQHFKSKTPYAVPLDVCCASCHHIFDCVNSDSIEYFPSFGAKIKHVNENKTGNVRISVTLRGIHVHHSCRGKAVTTGVVISP